MTNGYVDISAGTPLRKTFCVLDRQQTMYGSLAMYDISVLIVQSGCIFPWPLTTPIWQISLKARGGEEKGCQGIGCHPYLHSPAKFWTREGRFLMTIHGRIFWTKQVISTKTCRISILVGKRCMAVCLSNRAQIGAIFCQDAFQTIPDMSFLKCHAILTLR